MFYSYISLLIPTWFFYHGLENLFHKIGHNHKYGGYIYRIHRKHHTIHYPKTKLMDVGPYKTDYVLNISNGIRAYLPPMIITISPFYFIFEFINFLSFVSQIAFYAYLSDYIHTEIHLSNSWLNKYQWFQEKRRLHFIHHKRLNKNMNIIDFHIDRLYNTYDD